MISGERVKHQYLYLYTYVVIFVYVLILQLVPELTLLEVASQWREHLSCHSGK